ncbi:hypothetical protein AAG906_018991 [Vitis piasezkii]
MSFWINESFTENNLCEVVRGVAGDLVEEVQLIDNFTNKKGMISQCYRIACRSMERLRTDEEINELQVMTNNLEFGYDSGCSGMLGSKETLRLQPGFTALSRQSSQDCTVAGYHIPANTELLVNVWAMGRDPNYWENPFEFSPSRFLNEDGSIKKGLDVKGQQFLLLPFGSGRRIWPGASLTLQIVPSTIAAVIQCFDWKVGDGGNGSINMEEGHGSSRAHPLVCVPVGRFNPFLTHAG